MCFNSAFLFILGLVQFMKFRMNVSFSDEIDLEYFVWKAILVSLVMYEIFFYLFNQNKKVWLMDSICHNFFFFCYINCLGIGFFVVSL